MIVRVASWFRASTISFARRANFYKVQDRRLSAKGIRAPVSSVPLYSRARIHHAGLRGATRLELIRIAASRPDDVLRLRTRGLGFDKRQALIDKVMPIGASSSSTKSPSELSSSSPVGVSSEIGSLTILSTFVGVVPLRTIERMRPSRLNRIRE